MDSPLEQINDMYDVLLERLNVLTKLYIDHANDLVKALQCINYRRDSFNSKISNVITNEYDYLIAQEQALNQIGTKH
jgi:hypothetical protein